MLFFLNLHLLIVLEFKQLLLLIIFI